MPLSKVGLNINGLNSTTAPDFNITTDPTNFMADMAAKANLYTHNLVGLGIMLTVAAYLYYKLSDKSPVSDFGYSQLRSISLSSGIAGVVGMVMFTIGYFRQIYPVIFFIVICMIGFIFVYKEERS